MNQAPPTVYQPAARRRRRQTLLLVVTPLLILLAVIVLRGTGWGREKPRTPPRPATAVVVRPTEPRPPAPDPDDPRRVAHDMLIVTNHLLEKPEFPGIRNRQAAA